MRGAKGHGTRALQRATQQRTWRESATAAQIAAAKGDPVFERITLSVNGTATAGTQFVWGDFDHDGDIDIASAGKLGVHVFENLSIQKVPKAVREETQPLNRKWPFPGEGKEVEQEEGPAPKK